MFPVFFPQPLSGVLIHDLCRLKSWNSQVDLERVLHTDLRNVADLDYNFEANVSRLVTIFYISLLFAYFVKFDDRITVMLLMWMNSTGGVPSPCWGGGPAPNGEVQVPRGLAHE